MNVTGVRSDRWSRIRSRKLADPVARERYERTRQSVSSIRRVLQLVDAERERAGLTKAELAQRVGASPAAVRRLLTSEASNPTLRTVLDLFDALGLELSLRPKAPGQRGRAPRPSRSSAKHTVVV